MKKIYTLLAAIGLCAMSASAITVKYVDGGSIENGETITVNRGQFEHQYYPGVLDWWKGQVDIVVEGSAPINVDLSTNVENTDDKYMQFCPIGESCYVFDKSLIGYTAKGTLRNNSTTIPIDMNYRDFGENLPEEVNTINCTFTDANSTFKLTVKFDTTDDTGVDAVWAADGKVTVYNFAGVCLLADAEADALQTLPAGLYIVNGKKMVIK